MNNHHLGIARRHTAAESPTQKIHDGSYEMDRPRALSVRPTPKILRKISTRLDERQASLEQWRDMTTIEKDVLRGIHKKTSKKVQGEVVFGGSNQISCMIGPSNRCFGGDKPARIFSSLLLMNVPTLILYFFTIDKLSCQE